MKSTNSSKLERWLGKDIINFYVDSMKKWKGGPIPLAGVPGDVYIRSGGDFFGNINGGQFANIKDFNYDFNKKNNKLNAGFSSLSDLITKNNINHKYLYAHKTISALEVNRAAMSCFNVGSFPIAGGVGGTSGTGRICNNTTTGALPLDNIGDIYITDIHAAATATTLPNAGILLVDRLWDMTYNHASSTSTAITSPTLTRSVTAVTGGIYNNDNFAINNFVAGEVTTILSATAHNLTFTCAGHVSTTDSSSAITMSVSSPVNSFPIGSGSPWFIYFSDENQITSLTNIAQSTTASVTGVSNWFIGKAIAWIPVIENSYLSYLNGITSNFSFYKIHENACLFFYIPMTASVSGALNASFLIRTVKA